MAPTPGPTESMLPAVGSLFAGKYVIERLLGKGGMGAVFLARHQVLGQRFAIKCLLGDTSASSIAVARFLNEARNAATLQSEYVARVTDAAVEGTLPYMVMEYLDGEDLSAVVARGPLPTAQVADYVLQALEGIALAHQAGIVHRDLKPSNLFLARRGDATVVKVLDFGISKGGGELGSPSLTSTSAVLGSPAYMAPEQIRSSRSADHRADIWALGLILYELTTGRPPFTGTTLGEVFAAIIERSTVPFAQLGVSAPPGFESIILRCLQKNRDDRFQSCAQLAAALAPFAPATAQLRPLVVQARAVPEQASPMAATMVPASAAQGPAVPALVGASTTGAAGYARTSARDQGAGQSLAPMILLGVLATFVLAALGTGGVFLMKARAAAAGASSQSAPSAVPSASSLPKVEAQVPADTATPVVASASAGPNHKPPMAPTPSGKSAGAKTPPAPTQGPVATAAPSPPPAPPPAEPSPSARPQPSPRPPATSTGLLPSKDRY